MPCCVFLISHFGICYATQLTDTNIKICKTSRLSRASKNTTLYQLKLTQERSPRVPLHINSARGFRLGGDLYRHHHHHYNTCARGLYDAITNKIRCKIRTQTPQVEEEPESPLPLILTVLTLALAFVVAIAILCCCLSCYRSTCLVFLFLCVSCIQASIKVLALTLCCHC